MESKAVRLSWVHEPGKVTPKFGVVFPESMNDAGQCLLNRAILAGFGQQTHLHAIGDGVPWIAEPVQDKFGQQGNYLVDFYHVGDYLAAANPYGAKNDTPTNGLETPKPALKNHTHQPVIQALEPYLEANDIGDQHVLVIASYPIVANRLITKMPSKKVYSLALEK